MAEARAAAQRIGEQLRTVVASEIAAGHLTPTEAILAAQSAVASLAMREGFTRDFLVQFIGESWGQLRKIYEAGKLAILQATASRQVRGD